LSKSELDSVFSGLKILRVNNVSEPSGQIIYGPLEIDYGYLIGVRACDQASGDCIQSEDVLYSLSTLAPQGLSEIKIESISGRSIFLTWERPRLPNDYFLSYQVYRRLACNQSSSKTGDGETNKVSSKNGSGKLDGEKKVTNFDKIIFKH